MSSLKLPEPGSATGNQRNKTVLKPGHSLMDWVQLCNSGDVSKRVKKFSEVYLDELQAHNKCQDAWLVIDGVVFNVTQYLPFHPGGEDELLSVIGTDATEAFNKVHSWVNYHSLLKACMVGRFRNYPRKDTETTNVVSDLNIFGSQAGENLLKMDWFERNGDITMTHEFQIRSQQCSPPQICYGLSSRNLTIMVGEIVMEYELREDVEWPHVPSPISFRLKRHNPRKWVSSIYLVKRTCQMWGALGKEIFSQPCQEGKFFQMVVAEVVSLTRDTVQFTLKYAVNVTQYIHPGHCVKLKIAGMERFYTPVRKLWLRERDHNDNSSWPFLLTFVVKGYSNGNVSPKLLDLKTGDFLEMSPCIGKFDAFSTLKERRLVLMLAAGTGITPMTSVIRHALYGECKSINVSLIFFNKTREDIIWKDDIDTLKGRYPNRFSVLHVLSEPAQDWQGARGLVSEQLLHPFLMKEGGLRIKQMFACVCGPLKFTQQCAGLLEKLEFTPDEDFHIF